MNNNNELAQQADFNSKKHDIISDANIKSCYFFYINNISKNFDLDLQDYHFDESDELKQSDLENALTKDLKPKKPVTLPESLRVVKEQGLECWLNEEKNEVTFTGTVDLSKHSRDWAAEVLRQVQLVVRRLPARDTFNRVINNLKNGGTK